jgi:hypothetical protein
LGSITHEIWKNQTHGLDSFLKTLKFGNRKRKYEIWRTEIHFSFPNLCFPYFYFVFHLVSDQH